MEGVPVTVCVAAICQGNTIFGASDRMLTAGDIQFEPQQPKIIVLTRSIVVMVAGDSSMQSEIIQKVQADVSKRIEVEPQNWWNVRDVADLYSRYCGEARLRRAEHQILEPVGLTQDTFISRQKEMDSGFVRQLATELINFDPPKIAAICCGVDLTGAHIYLADNTNVTCEDLVGFAAIGAGAGHANSQLMFAGHTRYRPMPETLLLVYSAKKRAEVAPGVGKATDMFAMGPALGSYAFLEEAVKEELEKIYKTEQRKEQRSRIKSKESVTRYVEEITRAATHKEQAAKPANGGGDTPTDKKDV